MNPHAWSNPPNPFAPTALEYLEEDHPRAAVHVWDDSTKGILATNDSPDVGFRFSVNPYRGCMHACAYCYARPAHEYLGFGAGTDFDTQDRREAPGARAAPRGVLEAVLEGRAGGLQRRHRLLPAARGVAPPDARLPRGLRRVPEPGGHHHQVAAHRARLDVLAAARPRRAACSVAISLPFWDQDVRARHRAGRRHAPQRRIQVIERLAAAGIGSA